MSQAQDLDALTVGIIWRRMVAAVEEVSGRLRVSAFSTLIQEANDFATVVLASDGRLLAQAASTSPIFARAGSTVAEATLERFGAERLQPGDVVLTNDPWLGGGHLNDVAVITPIHIDGALVGFAASIAHSPDIGGRLWAADAREIFEEGLQLPVMKLFQGGVINRDLEDIIASNVRVPTETLGDLHALVATNEILSRRVTDTLAEYDLDGLDAVGSEFTARSERAMRGAIQAIPDGTYEHAVTVDGFDEPLRLAVRLVVEDGEMHLDYAGTSPQTASGVNSAFNYTYGWATYALKSSLAPTVPHNHGTFVPISVTAPVGCVLNAVRPAALGAKGRIGHFIPYTVLGALARVQPKSVMAESGNNGFPFIGGHDRAGRAFTQIIPCNGGLGARSRLDGISACSYPSNVANVPVEVIESRTSLRILAKRLLADTGGVGEFRGGLGQELVVALPQEPEVTAVTASMLTTRTEVPAAGVLGGGSGSRQQNVLDDGSVIHAKRQQVMTPGTALTIRTPGGGGYGEPTARDVAAVGTDVRLGYVTREAAARDYGVVIDDNGRVDRDATRRRRAAAATSGAQRPTGDRPRVLAQGPAAPELARTTHAPSEAPARVFVSDVTLREGDQAGAVALRDADKRELAEALASAGVDQIQLGYAPQDVPFIKSMTTAGLGVPCDVLVSGLATTWQRDVTAAVEAGADVVTVIVRSSPELARETAGLEPEEVLERVAETIAFAKSVGARTVIYSPSFASQAPLGFLTRVAVTAASAGADRVIAADSLGVLSPVSTSLIVSQLRSGTDADIVMHCHDDFGLAVANTIAGVQAGAKWVDVSLNGLGERAGNAPLDEVVVALKLLYGVESSVDTTRLVALARLAEERTGVEIPHAKAVVGSDAFAQKLEMHVAVAHRRPELFEPFPPSLVGNTRAIRLGTGTGPVAMRSKLAELGLTLSGDTLTRLVDATIALAQSQRRAVTDAELVRLARGLEAVDPDGGS